MNVSNHSGYEACPDREAALERHLFNQLEEREQADLREHIAICPGCRMALEEAVSGLAGLDELDEPPLPFGETPLTPDFRAGAEEAWHRFLETAAVRKDRPGWGSRMRPLAAAALLLIGIGIGYLALPGGPGPVEDLVPADVVEIEAGAVEALVRAEFLADLGLPYIDGVLELVAMVMELDQGDVTGRNVEAIRARARDLLRDGRLLQRGLEPERDRMFLATVDRAALFLEEVAILGGEGGEDGSLNELRETLQLTGLGDRLVALDVDGAVSEALEASGWIGEEYAQSRETVR